MKILHLFVSFVLSTSVFSQGKKVFEDMHVTTRNMGKFSHIKVNGPYTVHYTSGDSYSIAVGTPQSSMQENIITKVKDEVLEISSSGKSLIWWSKDSKVNIYISNPTLKQVTASGAVNFNIHDVMSSDDLALVFSGASEFTGSLNLNALYANFSGASDMNVSGKVSKATLKFSGASDANAFSLTADTVHLISTGASSVRITANKILEGVASGASDIKYKGSPVLNVRSSGASDISQKK